MAALTRHYLEIDRPEAVRSLLAAVDRMRVEFEAGTIDDLPAPRPYPSLARQGWAWTKSGRYWIAYQRDPNFILAIFYDAANIPARL